jgi:hypothetical protein
MPSLSNSCVHPFPFFATWRHLLLTGAAVVLGVTAWAATAAETAGGENASNVYLAGTEVHTDGPIHGDLVAAAGRIRIDHPVSGDAVLAAGSIEMYSGIGDDLRAAGGIISVSGHVAGEAVLAGGSVSLGPDSEIGKRTWIAGNDVVIGGRLRNGLKVYGKKVLLLGEVAGPVDLSADQIEILGSARILGDITYSSHHQIRIAPNAMIAGKIVRTPGTFEFYRPKFKVPGWPAFRPLLLLGFLAAGMLLFALFPRFTRAAMQAIDSAPLKSLGLGAAIFFSLPPVILLLVITIIGIPIALTLLAFYATALLTGYLVLAFFLGDKLLRAARRPPAAGFGWRTGSLAAALVLLWLARHLPYVGGLVVLVALLAGLGAIVLQAFSNYSGRRA